MLDLFCFSLFLFYDNLSLYGYNTFSCLEILTFQSFGTEGHTCKANTLSLICVTSPNVFISSALILIFFS